MYNLNQGFWSLEATGVHCFRLPPQSCQFSGIALAPGSRQGRPRPETRDSGVRLGSRTQPECGPDSPPLVESLSAISPPLVESLSAISPPLVESLSAMLPATTVYVVASRVSMGRGLRKTPEAVAGQPCALRKGVSTPAAVRI
jgi:hypothetical protein